MSEKYHDNFYDMLFEMSNEIRHNILLLLQEKPERMTHIGNKLELTLPEISRHLSRLSESNLIRKDVANYYNLTYFGESLLQYLKDLDFLSNNRGYFSAHDPTRIPDKYLRRLGELSEYGFTDNVMSFLHFIDTNIKEAQSFVLFIVDQYPLTAIDSIIKTAERGIEIKIIEKKDLTGPDVAFDEAHLLAEIGEKPQIEINTLEENEVYLYASDKGCAVAFPTVNGFDYTGFHTESPEAIEWSKDLFNEMWEVSIPKTYLQLPQEVTPSKRKREKTITVQGTEDASQDYPAIQQAVNNFDEVVLKGRFNLGASRVVVNKSCVIRGEGRQNNIPLTVIYKKGWKFPFHEFDSLFMIDEPGIDVTIENIHFTDFNCTCILGENGGSVNVLYNRITLQTGIGRGVTAGLYGDLVLGVNIGGPRPEGGFENGVLIEGNYIDFATSYMVGGHFPQEGEENNPYFRPNLQNHEGYIGYGIIVNDNLGEVIIRDNIVRNMNFAGIHVNDNKESVHITIIDNEVISQVYGSYGYSGSIAGYGIRALSSFGFPAKGTEVDIIKNRVMCEKQNYVGISVNGQSNYLENSGKLGEVRVEENDITLNDGYTGIIVRKTDKVRVAKNQLSGAAYYALQVSGIKARDGFDLSANQNTIEDNIFNLTIKEPDTYSNDQVNRRLFYGKAGVAETTHVWLNQYTNENKIKLSENETLVDEGKKNEITIQ